MAGVSGITYVRYQAPDLDLMETFLVDFGLTKSVRTSTALYMRGGGDNHHIHITEFGDAPCALGAGLRVDTRDDLDQIAARAGVPVERAVEPGGGMIARLTDPNGFRIDIIHGQAKLDPLPFRSPLTLNNGLNAQRLGHLQRPKRGPSCIVRMEHAVFAGPNFEASLRFYQDLLGMKPSDEIYIGNEQETAAIFLHCGLGETYTDHHTVALLRHPETYIDHSAFVTLDWDDLALGHDHLASRGYWHEWGIGRHIMGSEIFDYWRDPFGFKLEHCVDGDMVNDDHRPARASFEEANLSIWAPRLSETFGEPRLEMAR